MTVIDVDTHWESTEFAPGEHPLEPWRDQLPPQDVEWLAHAIAGDLLRALPEHRRPDGRTLLPELVKMAEQRGGPVILHPLHDSTSTERIAWMDSIGIDHCLVNPGGYWLDLEFFGAERAPAAATAPSSSTRSRDARPATFLPAIRHGTWCGRPPSTSAWSP